MDVRWILNTELNGIEIYFNDLPEESIRIDLKDNGWRWNSFKKCWYNYFSDEHEEYAKEICGQLESDYSDDSVKIENYSFTGRMVKCVDCGKTISTHAKYCIGCGATMEYIKESYVREYIKENRKKQLVREREELRKIEEEKKRQAERKEAQEEAERRKQALEEQKRIEEKIKEELRKTRICNFRKMFNVKEDFFTDYDVERAINYFDKYGKNCGTHYTVDGYVVMNMAKFGGVPGFKLYINEDKIERRYFNNERI